MKGREEAVFVGEKYDLDKVDNISCYEQSNDEIFLSTRELRGSRLTREEYSNSREETSRDNMLKTLEKRT